MVYGLSSICARVNDQAKSAFGQFFLFSDFFSDHHEMTQQKSVLLFCLLYTLERVFGYNQNVAWRLGINVAKCQAMVVFVNDVRRYFSSNDF